MPSPFRSRVRVGFTVVELLVVLAIIILLVGILLVGLTQAAGSAQAAQTRFLMNSMAAGLVQFIAENSVSAKIRPDHSIYFNRDLPTPDKRLGQAAIIMNKLSKLAAA